MWYKPQASWMIVAALLAGPWAMPASAQLPDVTWIETIALQVDGTSEGQQGPSDATPEDISATLVGSGYNLSGGISYVPLSNPNAKAEIVGSYTSGISSMLGSCLAEVVFQIVVRQTSSPPVPVSTIPLRVMASGIASVTGDGSLPAGATASFTLISESTVLEDPFLIGENANVNNESGESSTSFDVDTVVEVDVDIAIEGRFTAYVGIATGFPQPGGASSSGAAEVDPSFEIGNQVIPGSSANYRDYYEIEYSNGWWALGPVSARETTWGKIKRMYEAVD